MKKYFRNLCQSLATSLGVGLFVFGLLVAAQAESPVSVASPTAGSETEDPGKASSADEVAIKKAADQLYAHVFRTPDNYPNMEPVKTLFTDRLYAIILPESLRKVETEDDVSALQFIPGNGGADTYALQTPEISGALATISVIFDGRDGRDGQAPHTLLLQFERQPDGRWLIATISDVYDGAIMPWVGSSNTAVGAPAATHTSDRIGSGKGLARQPPNRKN
jgi:hypothetical protein